MFPKSMNLTTTQNTAIQELKRRLAERFGSGIEVILFGSVARVGVI